MCICLEPEPTFTSELTKMSKRKEKLFCTVRHRSLRCACILFIWYKVHRKLACNFFTIVFSVVCCICNVSVKCANVVYCHCHNLSSKTHIDGIWNEFKAKNAGCPRVTIHTFRNITTHLTTNKNNPLIPFYYYRQQNIPIIRFHFALESIFHQHKFIFISVAFMVYFFIFIVCQFAVDIGLLFLQFILHFIQIIPYRFNRKFRIVYNFIYFLGFGDVSIQQHRQPLFTIVSNIYAFFDQFLRFSWEDDWIFKFFFLWLVLFTSPA